MHAPFDTGKVKIGCMYQSSVKPDHDKDALKLQSALLRKRPSGTETAGQIENSLRADTSGITIVMVCGVLMAAAIAAKWVLA